MQDNQILQKIGSFVPWTEEALWRAVKEVSVETGFIAGGEVHRRFLYDKAQTWRVRVEGVFHGEPASLRLECLPTETDEEEIRRAFRAQAIGSRVRPPRTFVSRPFDAARRYGYSLEEWVHAPPLFQQSDLPEVATKALIPFYQELRAHIREPFWAVPALDAETFSKDQLKKWRELAAKRNPELLEKHADLLERLEKRMIEKMLSHDLVFRHSHLAGGDVRSMSDGTFVVFANHFWSWRQPGYDLAFCIWNQWMGLPSERRNATGVKQITDIWLQMISERLSDCADPGDVSIMLLNRCFGSLILDIPAKHERHTPEELAAWEVSIIDEAERLLRM